MTNAPTSRHVTAEALADYFSGQLRPEQESFFDEHFAECDTCAQEARRFRVSLETRFRAFSAIWESWTANTHQVARQRAALHAALHQISPLRPEWQDRLQRWRERWGSAAVSALRSLQDVATEVSRVILTPIDMSAFGGGGWRFALATEAPSIKSVPRSGGAPIRGVPPPQSVSIDVAKPQARVTVRSETGDVEVTVDGWRPGQPMLLVLLIDLQGAQPPLVQELVEEAAGIAIARFTRIAPGEYVVAFEPEE